MESVVLSPPDVRVAPLLSPYAPESMAALGDWLAPAKPAVVERAKSA